MKRYSFLLLLILVTVLLPATEVPYCLTSAFGYGAGATGGGSATPTLVSNKSQLENALKSSNKVVIITQSISLSSMLTVQDVNNITLLGLPGVTLSNLNQTQSGSGVLYVKRVNNIIIRNLTFIGPGAYDCDGNDLLCFEKVTNAWVDHCDFQDGVDGNFDNKSTTDNVTVSWCRFRYLKAPKAGGSGGADDHRFSNLLGAGSTDKPSDGTYNFTWAYCWWDSGCKQRMVRCRNASLHFLNCYWNTGVADYYIGPENADAYVEGCWMAKLSSASRVFYQSFNASTAQNGVTFVNTYYAGSALSNVADRTVLVPSYTYTVLSSDDAKAAVSNATCGAGATLNVTSAGVISVSCSDTATTVDPTPVTSALTWSADDSDISVLGEIISAVTVRGLTIAATSGKAVTVDAVPTPFTYGSNGELSFSHRIKLGGGMSESARHLSFNVTGTCTVDVYCMSSSASASRTVNICTGTWNTNATQFENVNGTEVNRLTYNYTGDATTLFVGSASSGLNVLGINISYPNDPTALPETSAPFDSSDMQISCRKILIDGTLRLSALDGTLFSLDGRRIK